MRTDRWISKAKPRASSAYGLFGFHPAFHNAEWEKLSIFLNFLIPKLPAPIEEDLSRGILEAIDMESYRVEVRSSMNIILATKWSYRSRSHGRGGHMPEPELDLLSNISMLSTNSSATSIGEMRTRLEE
jgi:type I restriction enzyme R subunit